MFVRALLVFVCLFAAGAAHAAGCSKATDRDLHAAYDAWLAAYRAHDIDGTMAIFSREVVFQFQGAPDTNWDGLRVSYVREFASGSSDRWVPDIQAIEVSGDVAAVFSQWRLVGEATNGEVVKAHNNSVDVFERDDQCRWHIVRSLNYPLPR